MGQRRWEGGGIFDQNTSREVWNMKQLLPEQRQNSKKRGAGQWPTRQGQST